MGRQEVLAGYDDHTQIAKGRKISTKRQRPISPCGVLLTSSSSSTGCANLPASASSDIDGFGSYGSVSSGTTSEDVYDSTHDDHQEDEDMANCLILLAQGDAPRQPSLQLNDPMESFGVRKFSDTATGKGGFYLHKCKTCNRSFPSFQALGGHRASHKKPKAMVGHEEIIRKAPIFTEYPEEARFKRSNSFSPSKPLQTANIKGMHSNKAAKIHECSICGLEFMSGQALGGHMRRHRASTSSQVAMNIDAISTTMEADSQHVEIKPINILSDLDLNLPAPEEEETMLKLTTAGQQSLVLISSPALVDCHY